MGLSRLFALNSGVLSGHMQQRQSRRCVTITPIKAVIVVSVFPHHKNDDHLKQSMLMLDLVAELSQKSQAPRPEEWARLAEMLLD
jgi:hypothetical protein